MGNRLFGTDGVRGRANYFPMTVEVAMALGRACGKVFSQGRGSSRVVIGKDTRLSCYMFENALIAGLCSMGCDTLMLGPFPTPGVAFITRAYRADAGIVISASHNAFLDNGIKFFSSEGFKFPDSWEEEMESLVEQGDFSSFLPLDQEIGKNMKVQDADGRYIEFAKATFPKNCTLKNFKIVIDCAHGATYKVAPLIFEELDATVFALGCKPDGLNINDKVGALYPQNVQKGVIDHAADIGIALDGDGDRVIMVDENAQIVDGDVILGICAKDLLERGGMDTRVVVSTVMCNLGLKKAMERLGIELIQTRVGDRYVIESMLETGAVLGGEQSGHTIFLDHNTTGDGLVCALQVLRIMKETGATLSELATFVKKYPQTSVNVQVREKVPLDQVSCVQDKIREVESILGDEGRVLVRYSGTELICRVMVEGPDSRQVQAMAADIGQTIHDALGNCVETGV